MAWQKGLLSRTIGWLSWDNAWHFPALLLNDVTKISWNCTFFTFLFFAYPSTLSKLILHRPFASINSLHFHQLTSAPYPPLALVRVVLFNQQHSLRLNRAQ